MSRFQCCKHFATVMCPRSLCEHLRTLMLTLTASCLLSDICPLRTFPPLVHSCTTSSLLQYLLDRLRQQHWAESTSATSSLSTSTVVGTTDAQHATWVNDSILIPDSSDTRRGNLSDFNITDLGNGTLINGVFFCADCACAFAGTPMQSTSTHPIPAEPYPVTPILSSPANPSPHSSRLADHMPSFLGMRSSTLCGCGHKHIVLLWWCNSFHAACFHA